MREFLVGQHWRKPRRADEQARSTAAPTTARHRILDLQHGAGNQAMTRLLTATARDSDRPPPGMPLDPPMRSSMEARLGHDFSAVRIHDDQSAAQSASSLGAFAFTVGDSVVLGAAAPPLHSPQGQRVLAHELTHVVQQRLGGHAPAVDPESTSERDADAAASAIAHGATPAPISRGTAVGVARQPMDPRHARGYAGEQGMGFGLYRQEEGWIFFEGPSGSAGHGVTTPGFDGVAYNTRTGELHLVDNKSLAATGNVSSATAIDPTRNLAKNVDTLVVRVEAAKDVPGRIRILGLLRRIKAALAAGKPLPEGVKLVVTSVGGRTTDVTPRLTAAGVEHYPPPPKTATPAPPAAPQASAAAAKAPIAPPGEAPPAKAAPLAKAVPAAKSAPPVEVVPPVKVTLPTEAAPVPTAMPKMPTGGLPVAPKTSPWKAGLKAGGQAAAWMLLFAALDYYVHQKLQEQLENDIEQSRRGMHSWAVREKAKHPDQPVYFQIIVVSEEYSRYIPLLGWLPEPPKLLLASIGITSTQIESPTVTIDDHSLDLFHPGKTTSITYTELVIP